jgi:hypothetical protein
MGKKLASSIQELWPWASAHGETVAGGFNPRRGWLARHRLLFAAAILASLVPAASSAQTGALFPDAFVVEHHLIQDDGDGSLFTSEPVVDTYGGSWMVSVRPDGSRVIVDLARREMTGIEPEKGSYWTVSFDQLAQLQARLARTELPAGEDSPPPTAAVARAATTPAAPDLAVVEVALAAADSRVTRLRTASSGGPASASLRHLRVAQSSAAGAPSAGAAMDIWVDAGLRLRAPALDALEELETALAGPASATRSGAAAATSDQPPTRSATPASSPGRYLAAARRHAGGAFPVRTSRPLVIRSDGSTLGRIEDVALRLERLERFPSALAEIPEGLKRVPHPLEAVVRFLEEDALRSAALAGLATPAEQDVN